MEKQIPQVAPIAAYTEWGWEEFIACILSALSYFTILAGMALILLNQWTGYLLTVIALACAAGMFLIIDPKLKRISEDYEKKQKGYLEELDRIIEWEEPTGEERA